ncbi:MAG: amino acid ABC transporter substrate-binding protein [Burkholderiales bacterium]|nr:amino acid ABC transporter substrate-binding protein [Burkholderiales bacterium]
MKPALGALLLLLLTLGSGPCAAAGAPPAWSGALTGRLAHIKATGRIQLGYRQSAIPFSYVGAGGKPVGYSLDLCAAIAAAMAEELGGAPLAIDYVPVTAQNRIEHVESGAVDLECGASTNTAERRRRVAFSPLIFVTGTRLAVPRASAVNRVADLRGRPVAVVRATTNEAAMRELDRLQRLQIRFVPADDYREALSLLEAGKAEALAADDVLLRGVLVEMHKRADFRLVGGLFSFEPYGIMFARRDPQLEAVVERALRDLAASRELAAIYNRWFLQPLPSGGRIDLPMSTQLRRSFELIGMPTD